MQGKGNTFLTYLRSVATLGKGQESKRKQRLELVEKRPAPPSPALRRSVRMMKMSAKTAEK